ncbi:MAG: hypothetical protein ACI8TQ_000209 [Planctomycetota bacterium]|jgi:hypothetical protein
MGAHKRRRIRRFGETRGCQAGRNVTTYEANDFYQGLLDSDIPGLIGRGFKRIPFDSGCRIRLGRRNDLIG